MNCKRTQDQLSAHLDGQLPDGEQAQVREHLATCPRCVAELESLKRLSGLVDELPGMPAPEGFAERVRRAAAVRPFPAPQPQAVGSTLFGGVLTRVAAVLMLVCGLWVGVSLGGAVGTATGAGDGAVVAEAPQSSVEDADLLDLPVGSLSAAPVGSLTEVYLAMASDDE